MEDLSKWEWLLLTVLSIWAYEYLKNPMVKQIFLAFTLVLLLVTLYRWTKFFWKKPSSKKIRIEIDKNLDLHSNGTTHFFRGRIHNSDSHVEEAYVHVDECRGTVEGKPRETDKVPAMNFQWEADCEKRDMSVGEKNCIFDMAKVEDKVVTFIGYINGKKQHYRVGPGFYNFKITLYGKGIEKPVEHKFEVELTGLSGTNAIDLRKG